MRVIIDEDLKIIKIIVSSLWFGLVMNLLSKMLSSAEYGSNVKANANSLHGQYQPLCWKTGTVQQII